LTKKPLHALHAPSMQLADFDFDLSEDRIALRPAARAIPRDCWWSRPGEPLRT